MRFRLWRTKEQRWCLAHFESLVAQHRFLSDAHLVMGVKAMLKSDWCVSGARKAGKSPPQLVALAINKVAAENLLMAAEGMYAYRGMLTHAGQDTLRSYDFSLETLVSENQVSQQERKEEKKWIRDEIKGAG